MSMKFPQSSPIRINCQLCEKKVVNGLNAYMTFTFKGLISQPDWGHIFFFFFFNFNSVARAFISFS